MQEMVKQAPRSEWIEGRQAMQMPEDVQAILKLASLSWGAKRISRGMGCSRNTVRSYLRQGGWQPAQRAFASHKELPLRACWQTVEQFGHRGQLPPFE